MEKRQNLNPHEFSKQVQSSQETTHEQGKILRVKQGYNPNSSSIGSMIFVLPAALLGITTVFGAVSGVIMSTLMGDNAAKTKDAKNSSEGGDDE